MCLCRQPVVFSIPGPDSGIEYWKETNDVNAFKDFTIKFSFLGLYQFDVYVFIFNIFIFVRCQWQHKQSILQRPPALFSSFSRMVLFLRSWAWLLLCCAAKVRENTLDMYVTGCVVVRWPARGSSNILSRSTNNDVNPLIFVLLESLHCLYLPLLPVSFVVLCNFKSSLELILSAPTYNVPLAPHLPNMSFNYKTVS